MDEVTRAIAEELDRLDREVKPVDSLVPLYRGMASADTHNFRGLSIVQHQRDIGRLIRKVGAKTVLDFGCGRGDAYRSPTAIHNGWRISRKNVTLYDPAFRASNTMPRGKFDVVVCSDVLEHIPEPEVDAFIDRLFSYARLAVWASVCCRPAKKMFPGTETNMHVTVQPFDWWREKFQRGNYGPRWALVETP